MLGEQSATGPMLRPGRPQAALAAAEAERALAAARLAEAAHQQVLRAEC